MECVLYLVEKCWNYGTGMLKCKCYLTFSEFVSTYIACFDLVEDLDGRRSHDACITAYFTSGVPELLRPQGLFLLFMRHIVLNIHSVILNREVLQ